MGEKLIHGKVMNLEHSGDDVFVSVNGVPYNYKDGDEVTVPESFLNAINDAVKLEWYRDGNEMKKREKRRYMFIPTPEKKKDDEDEIAEEIVKDKQGAKEGK